MGSMGGWPAPAREVSPSGIAGGAERLGLLKLILFLLKKTQKESE